MTETSIFLDITGFFCYNKHMEATVEIPLSTMERLQNQITEMSDLIAKQTALLQYYEAQFRLLKRRQFGASSERVETDDYRQLTLFGDAEIPLPPKPEIEEVTYNRKKRKGKREEDLSNLPVVRVDHELPADKRDCPKCGKLMRDIGVTVRREIDIIPAQAILKEHAVHTYSCPDLACVEAEGSVTFVKADAPKPLITGSLASPSLVAHIAYQKYSNGMPLYRIEKGFQYDGVNISRQNMSNWVIKCVELYLITIYIMLKTHLLKESVLHGDETTIQVLHEAGRTAQTKSFEWVYRTSGHSDRKIVIYEYQETRKQEHPREFLKNFKGFLHCDGYQVYHNLPPEITVVGCWAHARRYFEKIWKTLPKKAREESDAGIGLSYINALFKFEREFVELPPNKRYQKRLEKSKPVADAFFAWADALGALPNFPLGQATHYAMSQRKYLENVFLDGRLELSNNRCERSVKPFVMGRKAWLFSNTPEGANASSVMYSIIETAKENGLHPFCYVRFLLEALPNMTSADNFEELLPWSGLLPDWCRVPGKHKPVDNGNP